VSDQELREQIGVLASRVRDHDVLLAQQSKLEADLAQAREQIADLMLKVELDGGTAKGYKPWENPRWWELTSETKEAEIGRVRGWVDQIAGPFLGLKRLPECLYEHDVAVILLDAACEAWKVLWLPEKRSAKTVAAQCEYLTRIWPQIKAEVFRELTGCDHQSGLAPVRSVVA
jgi:hypothetical protein